MTDKKHVSLKSMAEDRDLDAVGKLTNFLVDPAAIKVRPGFNPRPINIAHVEEMYNSFVSGASFDPLVVDVEEGEIYVVAGHHRREMYLLARERGHDIKRVEARQFRGTEADRVALTFTSQQGLALTPLQLATQYGRLIELGWTNTEVAARAGKTVQHVRDTLLLLDADAKTKKLLEKGKVSAEVVRTALRQHGADAGSVLATDLEKAEAAGKTKVTAKNATTKAPSKKDTAVALLERMREMFSNDSFYRLAGEYDDTLVDDVRKYLGIGVE